jgi:hypothetical protein
MLSASGRKQGCLGVSFRDGLTLDAGGRAKIKSSEVLLGPFVSASSSR